MRRSDLDLLVKEAGLAGEGIGKALAAAGLLGAGAYGLSKLKRKKHPPMMGAEGGSGDDEPTPAPGAPPPTGNRAALEEAMKYGTGRGLGKMAEELSAAARKHVKPKNFALPGGRYPINDASHARNALARASQHASPEEKAKIEAKVHKKYPGIGKKAGLEPFRAAFLEEVLGTGCMKLGHEHPEPFIDQTDKGVTQEDQQEFGHGKGMKKKPKAVDENAISMAAKKLASILRGSSLPAPAAAGAVLDDLT